MPGIRCIVPSQRKPQKPTDEVGPDDDIPF
jgi:hypothetical protein